MITVEWGNEEKTLIRWYLKPGWSWDDFMAARDQAHSLIDSVTWVVDDIILSESPRYIPANALTNLREISQERHPQHGLTYVVGVQSFISVLLNALGRIIPDGQLVRFADNEAEALAMIEETQKKRAGSDKPVA